MIYKYRSTGNASDRGGGRRLRLPPPRQPHPHGGDIPSTHCRGRDNLSIVSVNTLPESCFLLRWHGHRANRHALPAPYRGGGRRRWKRREVGVIYKYRSTGNASDRGRGVPPPPRQPSPTGAISHRRTAGEEHPFTWFPVKTPEESCSCSPATAIVPITPHCPPPRKGAGGGGVWVEKHHPGCMREIREVLSLRGGYSSPYLRRNRSPSPPIPQDTLPAPGSSGGKSRYTVR